MNDEQLVQLITKYVLQEINRPASSGEELTPVGGRQQATERGAPDEVVIGVGPAFMTAIRYTINGLSLAEVLSELRAGIEEEGLQSRVVKVYKTSDVSFIGKEAAKLSGSGISIGLQSKGTAIIHQRDLYPLTNLELFPQAPLMTLAHYRQVGRNAAKYVKAEYVTPVAVMNDPMVRASYQVKAALMHIRETELTDADRPSEEWAGV